MPARNTARQSAQPFQRQSARTRRPTPTKISPPLPRISSIGELVANWNTIAGDHVAPHTMPRLIVDGDTLVLQTSPEEWARYLAMCCEPLLERIQAAGLCIRSIRLKVQQP
jgi:hypothetical protein